jgi:hypothetical protein
MKCLCKFPVDGIRNVKNIFINYQGILGNAERDFRPQLKQLFQIVKCTIY